MRRCELFLGQKLEHLERGNARLGHDIAFEIKDLFKIFQGDVEHEADARGQRLHEPDVRHGRGQLDMPHAVAADFGQRDFNSALFADDAFVLHPLVLAAKAFIILHGAKDAGAEQAVFFRLEGAVVDRFGLLDLAVRPAQDLLRACDRDADLVEALGASDLSEQVHDFFVHKVSPAIPDFRYTLLCFRSTLRPSDRNSFTKTLKDSGMPISNVSSPRTTDS